MNRRDLLKCIGLGTLFPTTVLASKDRISSDLRLREIRKPFILNNGIDKIFEPVEIEEGGVCEFPLDLLAPGLEHEYQAYSLSNNQIDDLHPYKDTDYIRVPMCRTDDSSQVNDDAWHTLLGACIDRNISVYDKNERNGRLTKRLIKYMRDILIKTGDSTKIYSNHIPTDIFFDRYTKLTKQAIEIANENEIKLHQINLNQYTGYYRNVLGARPFESTKSSLVIMADLRYRDSAIIPFNNNQYGVAILDSSKFLLGQV